MALIDTLNAIMNNFPEVIQNNVVENYPLWKYLGQSKIGQASGDEIQVYTIYGTPSLNTWDGTSTLTASETEISTKAVYNWAYSYIAEKIEYKNFLAAANAGKHVIANLATQKAQAIERGFGLGLESELFSVYDGTNHTFNGIPDIVNSADPTNQASGLGGIAVADASWWAAHTLAYNSANGDLRWHMQKMVRMLSVPPFGMPDLIITTGDVIDKFAGEVMDKQGYMSESVEKAKGFGFPIAFTFDGIPVTWSPNATSGTMYFLNSKFLSLVVHPNDFINISPWKETSTTDKNLISTATLTAQLVTSARQAMGYITGIA